MTDSEWEDRAVCVRRSGDRLVWCWVIWGTPAHTCQAVSTHTHAGTHGEHMQGRGVHTEWLQVGEWGWWAKKNCGIRKMLNRKRNPPKCWSGQVLQKKVSMKLVECGNPTDPLPASGTATDGSRNLRLKSQAPDSAGRTRGLTQIPLDLCSPSVVKLWLPRRNCWRKSVLMSSAEGEHPGCTYGSNVSTIPTALLTHTHWRQHVLVR